MSLPPSHDPLNDRMAAAVHGDLLAGERAQLESLLQKDPAARAAYQETLAMHDLLEKTHREAQPDSAFESRMVSGVRRKVQDEAHRRESAWESLTFFWKWAKANLPRRKPLVGGLALAAMAILLAAGLGYRSVVTGRNETTQFAISQQLQMKATPVPDGTQVANASNAGNAPRALIARMEDAISAQSAPPSDATPVASMTATAQPRLFPQDGAKDKLDRNGPEGSAVASTSATTNAQAAPSPAAPEPVLKLIRNAQLDLQVKSFPAAMDQIGAMTKAASGYVDSSSSEKGANGKLQGTVVVKIVPESLDAFLLKLRDVGSVQNQTVSAENVTKAYYDIQARLDNAHRMEAQLQDLLAHQNSKVSDLLQVERELGRVRGQIEEMQGQLKLYDFQVQYATVTIQLKEKDLNQAAAYLLKEQDDFSLFSPDVEGTFQKARAVADSFKAQVLRADLNHGSGSDITAELMFSVAPDQIEPFLNQIRALGRVDNFTRQTQRVAQDGGDSDQPADQTRTDRDNVQVHVTLKSDDETPMQQTDMSVRVSEVENEAQAIKKQAANGGVEVRDSSFERRPDGTETANLKLRLPLSEYPALLAHLKQIGKVESLTVQRQDRPVSSVSEEAAPVEIALELHNQGDVVPDDSGLWPTLRQTFGEGVAALFSSVRTIGVLAAFLAPWIITLAFLAWAARRLYLWRRR